jgi:hypothetical protein
VSDVNIIILEKPVVEVKKFLRHKEEMRLLVVLHVEVNALLSFICLCEDMFGDGSTAETCSNIM